LSWLLVMQRSWYYEGSVTTNPVFCALMLSYRLRLLLPKQQASTRPVTNYYYSAMLV
jgi:hypothetical protein